MTDKNLLRRIERIEEVIFANVPPSGKLSPALQEAVDLILARIPEDQEQQEGEAKIEQ